MERGGAGRSRGGGGEERSVAEGQLFREDVIQSVAQPSQIGLVLKVGGDSDSEDSSSDSEDEEEERGEVADGSARVCWMNLKETTEKVGDIKLIDRAFMHGDIVAKARDPLGQTGTVVNVEMLVNLKLPSGEIVKDVNSRRLRRVRAFAIGDYVIHGMWLGRVDEVVDNVTVIFGDGAKCKVLRADPDRLLPWNDSVMDDSDSPYFQGQKVHVTSPSVFRSAKWLKGAWKASRMEGIVVDVEACSVVVYWIAAGNLTSIGYPHSSDFPSEEQDAKKLLPIVYFSHTNWQLGDRSLPPARMRPRTVVPIEGNEVDGIPSDGDAESSLHSNTSARGPETVDLNSCGSGDGCKGGGDGWTVHRRKGKQQRRAIKREKKLQKKEKSIEYAVLVVYTRTMVDVLWQDGTVSQRVDACSLIPVDHLGDHDFWPEQYVMERGADGEGLDVEPRRVGVVKVVDAKQRTASVRWLNMVKRLEEPREFESEEVVSVYELVEHPDYSYCLGDVVIRLIPAACSTDDRPSLEDSELTASSGVEETSEADADDSEADFRGDKPSKHGSKRRTRRVKPSSQDLSWVGVIIGLQDGDIEVAWADGMVSKVGPQGILVVNRDLDDSSSTRTSDLEDAEDVDDAGSWETVVSEDEFGRINQREPEDQAERPSWDRQQDAVDHENLGAESPSDARANDGKEEEHAEGRGLQNSGGPFKLPRVAFGIVSRLTAGLLGLGGVKMGTDLAGEDRASSSQCQTYSRHGLEEILDGGAASGEQTPSSSARQFMAEGGGLFKRDALSMLNDSVLKSIDTHEQEQEVTSLHTPAKLDYDDEGLSALVDSHSKLDDGSEELCLDGADADGNVLPMDENKRCDMKHFDCIKDPSDHHYISETGQPTNRRKWVKKIQQEWSILERNLPDSIYVRVYEDRMDLLRAVIVGASGTPYHDGLFVFDFYLPPEYPSVPPVAHYHSGGLRLNPNLYENGKVCLSLLNTWIGKGSEIWHPSTSSILQLLVSIQGLVLNAKPYFNEAGYDKQVGTGEGEKNSLVYNENSFLLSCKSMLYLLRRSPRHFEHLIGDHFRNRGHYVLLACHAYLAGAEVGTLKESDLSAADRREVTDRSSAGFKLMLNKLVPKLTAAFQEVGAKL